MGMCVCASVALYVGQSILHFFFIYFFTRQHFHAKAGKEMPWLATKKGSRAAS